MPRIRSHHSPKRKRKAITVRASAPRIVRKRKGPLTLKDYLRAFGHSGRPDRERFAKRVGTSLLYLEQIGMGVRKPSVELAIKIERASWGQVRCETLLPGIDWDYLAQRRQARGHPPPPQAKPVWNAPSMTA